MNLFRKTTHNDGPAERCPSRPALPGDEIPPQCDLLAGHSGKHEFVDRFLEPAHVEYVLRWPR